MAKDRIQKAREGQAELVNDILKLREKISNKVEDYGEYEKAIKADPGYHLFKASKKLEDRTNGKQYDGLPQERMDDARSTASDVTMKVRGIQEDFRKTMMKKLRPSRDAGSSELEQLPSKLREMNRDIYDNEDLGIAAAQLGSTNLRPEKQMDVANMGLEAAINRDRHFSDGQREHLGMKKKAQAREEHTMWTKYAVATLKLQDLVGIDANPESVMHKRHDLLKNAMKSCQFIADHTAPGNTRGAAIANLDFLKALQEKITIEERARTGRPAKPLTLQDHLGITPERTQAKAIREALSTHDRRGVKSTGITPRNRQLQNDKSSPGL